MKTRFLNVALVVCFVPALALAQTRPGPATPVDVINDASNPVPVTLTNGVSVSGSVNVTNTPANPVPVVGIVDVVPRQPYQEFGITTIPVNLGNNFINFPTPAGKRYVIEFVSVA